MYIFLIFNDKFLQALTSLVAVLAEVPDYDADNPEPATEEDLEQVDSSSCLVRSEFTFCSSFHLN